MFWHVENLAKQTMLAGVMPWTFKPSSEISLQIRHDKTARQNWYRSADTVHQFYTPLEPANPNMRPSKDNPPRAIHAIVADYDIKIPQERVEEAISAMLIKPSWTERSLGGNVRLVWLFPRPIPTETYDFTTFVLKKVPKWLNLELLPMLDEPALTTPTRLYCNGGEWKSTGHPPVSENVLQAFFVACGKEFRFKGTEGPLIPLDLAEAELRKQYPAFQWPGEFIAGSQGPTFWIPESTSPMSAIVKEEGIITFSAHAAKPFYSWFDLLGAEFVKKFAQDSIAIATADSYWDGKRFWRKKDGVYVSMDATEMHNHFKVTCRLSSKSDNGGPSAVDNALNHIYNAGYITGAAPFVCRPPGIIDFMGKRTLNTYCSNARKPADEPAVWPHSFPFIASLLDNLFEPEGQLAHFLAWWKYFYISALNCQPMPGQNIFLMGGAGVGKTLLNREIVGRSVGRQVDASGYLIKGAVFNSDLFESPLWCVDDENAAENENSRQNFSSMLKKSTANSTFTHNKKFEVSVTVEWMGRIFCTTNLDYVSSRLLGSMDNTSKDKTNLYKCSREPKIVFPSRLEVVRLIESELSQFLRFLLDWQPPDYIVPDSRFGYKSYQEPTLLDQAQQGSKSAPFKELLVESLTEYFASHPGAKEFKGSVTQVIRLLFNNPLNEMVLRSMKLEQTSRYLEIIQREGQVKCRVETGKQNERIWAFEDPTIK